MGEQNTPACFVGAAQECIIPADERRNPAHTKRLLARNLRWSQYDLADESSLRQALISVLEVATRDPTWNRSTS
jgi:predicted transcriptional regulator